MDRSHLSTHDGLTLLLKLHSDSHLEAHFNQDLHQGAHIHQEDLSPLLHHESKPKASLRVSERTWESRRIKEEMQGILSPTPLELHKVSHMGRRVAPCLLAIYLTATGSKGSGINVWACRYPMCFLEKIFDRSEQKNVYHF